MGEGAVSSVGASLFLFEELALDCLEVVAEALSLLLGLTTSTAVSTVSTLICSTSSGFKVLSVLLVTTRDVLILLVRLSLRLAIVVLRHAIRHRSAATHKGVLVTREALVHLIAVHLLAEHAVGSRALVSFRSSVIKPASTRVAPKAASATLLESRSTSSALVSVVNHPTAIVLLVASLIEVVLASVVVLGLPVVTTATGVEVTSSSVPVTSEIVLLVVIALASTAESRSVTASVLSALAAHHVVPITGHALGSRTEL